MKENAATGRQEAIITKAGVDFDRLEKWHKDYMVQDCEQIDAKDLIILAVGSDHIDVGEIES